GDNSWACLSQDSTSPVLLASKRGFFYVQTANTFSSSKKNRVCFLLFSFDQGEILVQHYFHYFLI
ncbi:hypothetical protein, partial [Massilicoli timonensis]|uniref:hypothetical protein n=1 Tax=Massilicoli timonensis TaxID=2015901 RepID=UPI0023F15F17